MTNPWRYQRMITDFIEKQKLYDRLDELEARVEKLENVTPETNENNT